MTLSEEAKNEIRWWQNNIFDKNGKDIRPSKIQFYLETDASKAGWVPIFMVKKLVVDGLERNHLIISIC